VAESPEAFWLTPHDIYVKLTTGPGSHTLDVVQQSVHAIWRDEAERAALIHIQAMLIESAWQGAAGEGAAGAAQPLAASALAGADLLEQAQDLMDRQSGSFNRAKNDVVPVPPEPPKPDLLDVRVAFTDYEKSLTAYQADAQHNIDVFSNYDGASDYNETRMPASYSTSAHSGGTINVVPDAGQRGDTGDFIEVADYEPPRGEPRSSGERVQVDGPPRGGPTSGPVSSDSQPPQQTAPSDFVTPSGNPPNSPLPTPPQPGSTGGFATGLPVGGFTGGGPVGSGGPGARGGVYGGSGGPGTGGPGSAGRGPGVGMRGGMLGAGPGVGALAAEEAAAQRAAAAAAARGAGSGMVGGAPVGAGRGKNDEDEDHKRKVLIEADAEGLFGSDVLTAPEVIGDDEYEDD
jgi:hypothetical protein